MTTIRVEVAYATADQQCIVALELRAGATVREAIEASRIVQRFPHIELTRDRVGIFGRVASLSTRLRDRDRVEIYRPLTADAKQMRRRRAEARTRAVSKPRGPRPG